MNPVAWIAPGDIGRDAVTTAAATAYQTVPLYESGPVGMVSEPTAVWGDPRVQIVYDTLCNKDDWPPNPAEHWEGWIARRIVDALSAPGMVSVPLEPTEEMALAAVKASLESPQINGLNIWRAMLEAAPK